MNIPDHISESFKTNFWVKLLKSFDADPDPGIFLTLDPGSNMGKFVSGIWVKHPRSAALRPIPDPGSKGYRIPDPDPHLRIYVRYVAGAAQEILQSLVELVRG
jgi:hypothetical protein